MSIQESTIPDEELDEKPERLSPLDTKIDENNIKAINCVSTLSIEEEDG